MTANDPSTDREHLVRRLHEDLVGPHSESEVLKDRPSDVYLTGILWPQRTEMGGEDDDSLAVGGAAGGDDSEESEAAAVPTASIQKPSVAGVSFCFVAEGKAVVRLTCRFARYLLVDDPESKEARWHRRGIEVLVDEFHLSEGSRHLDLGDLDQQAKGAQLHVRCIDGGDRWLATISLINTTKPAKGRDELEHATLFQTGLNITAGIGTKFVPKPAQKDVADAEEHDDERSGMLLFRNAHEFAAGHTCSVRWDEPPHSKAGEPSTEWIEMHWLPSSILPGVDASGHAAFAALNQCQNGADPLSPKDLSELGQDELRKALEALCGCYGSWIETQGGKLPTLDDEQRRQAEANLSVCSHVLLRMEGAVSEICANNALTAAFQLANRAMHVQHAWDPDKVKYGDLRWRPFQLGFLLLSAPSAARPGHADRAVMDLLWFPTGGGKTEAYLALIALVAFYRRFDGARDGVAAIMRYTLRLLTTQQFARSAAMILACEAMRTGRIAAPHQERLSRCTPFSIGLWVGGDATPNTHAIAWASLNGARDVPSPAQLAKCPACRSAIRWSQGGVDLPVIASCTTESCALSGELPVFTVDTDVYRERPTLLIGTVDKFAQIVRRPETNRLFGIASGTPPDLVVQDELHLISGPLGTVAGTYEAAFDLLFSAGGAAPKIIGSTATIRRATEQVRDLFNRIACQFPPAAIDHDDSGFAVRSSSSTGRRYIGVTTAGRSAKFTLQAVAGSLLQSAAAAFGTAEARDPYWTLVGYFNSLRELGGALVLMQDDVSDSIKLYAHAHGEAPRSMKNVDELTSRRTQAEILEMLGLLAIRVGHPGALDTVLATNMVSVGVDIPRLGLMVVNGQPKSISEYIQSTSRVGRGAVSGLVVSVLNNAKARDRSHFETFPGWHKRLYRNVEATSVTPFASRARDRALHAALVAAVRHLAPGMLAGPTFNDAALAKAQELIGLIVERARGIDPEEVNVEAELERRLVQWSARSPPFYWQDYKDSQSLLQSAERAAWKKALGRNPGAAWPTLNSMRNVEAGTPFRMAPVLRAKGSNDGE